MDIQNLKLSRSAEFAASCATTVLVRWVLAVSCVLPMAAYGYSAPSWLYTVNLPVERQTSDERQRVASAGLLAVLTRVTGLTSIPRNETVRAALADPSRYYNEFRFFAETSEGRSEDQLSITFQRDLVLELVREARLPVWWTRRPTLLVWAVIEEQGQRTVLSGDSDHPLRDALLDYAEERGLTLRLPFMDIDDQLMISASDVWGNVTNTIEDASARYRPDVVMTLRMRSSLSLDGRRLNGNWSYWFDGQPVVVRYDAEQFDVVAREGLEPLVNRLVSTYGVPARRVNLWQLEIGGLAEIGTYVDLLGYFEGLDFIEGVDVSALDQEVLTVVLKSRAGAEQLLRLLTAEARLVEDTTASADGVRLVWRG